MNKMNKRGFTLIELLAVIVVLALIMVLAVPSILSSMNNAKKKTFQMYGQRLLDSALAEHESQKMLNTLTSKRYNGHYCYTIKDLGYQSQGSYIGFVEVESSSLVGNGGLNATQYTLHLTDSTFAYNAVSSSNVSNDTSTISSASSAIEAVKTNFDLCKIPE